MRKETLELLIKTTVLANKARYKRDIGTSKQVPVEFTTSNQKGLCGQCSWSYEKKAFGTRMLNPEIRDIKIHTNQIIGIVKEQYPILMFDQKRITIAASKFILAHELRHSWQCENEDRLAQFDVIRLFPIAPNNDDGEIDADNSALEYLKSIGEEDAYLFGFIMSACRGTIDVSQKEVSNAIGRLACKSKIALIGTAVLGAIVASMIVTMRAILKKGDK